MKIRNQSVMLVSALTITSIAPVALAGASKTMSGAACHAEAYVGVNGGAYRVIDESGFYNGYSTPIDVTCDLVRDNSTNTTKAVDVFVRITDGSTNSGFQCAVQSCTFTGQSCSSTSFSTSASFTGTESINAPIPQSFFNGYYVVTCSVPPGSYIHSLYVYEPD